MTTETIERKVSSALIEFKDNSAAGEFEGRASTFGVVDLVGDKVAAGAYAKTLGRFVQRGFISWQHDWHRPVGLVKWAREASDGLWIGGQFHTDTDSQRVRTLVKERLAADRFVGLSIGFTIVDSHRDGQIRVLDELELHEVAVVMTPAEPGSHIETVKASVAPGDPLERMRLVAKHRASCEICQQGFRVEKLLARYPAGRAR